MPAQCVEWDRSDVLDTSRHGVPSQFRPRHVHHLTAYSDKGQEGGQNSEARSSKPNLNTIVIVVQVSGVLMLIKGGPQKESIPLLSPVRWGPSAFDHARSQVSCT